MIKHNFLLGVRPSPVLARSNLAKFSFPHSCTVPRVNLIPRAQQDHAPTSSAASQSMDEIPPGCTRYSVQLRKPLGIVLEETANGTITIAEIVPGGNAEKSGLCNVGDVLIATSGYTRNKEQMYGETRVFTGEELIRLNVRGETFDTVLAAIGSHPGNFSVKLEFQRC